MKRNIYNLNYVLLFATLLFGSSLSAQWNQLSNDIDGETPGDQSGRSTSLSSNGNIIAIGSIFNSDNGTNSGHVRVYENIGGSWTQIGQDINGESAGDYSGVSVSISSDGNTVAIGASSNDGNGTNSGHVRIYENIGGSWTQVGQDIDGESQDDQSGVSVSINSNGNIVAIGAFANDGNGTNSGHVRLYENIGGSWTQIGQDIDGEDTAGGISVSLNSNGNIVAIGERQYGLNITGFSDGRVRMFENLGGSWVQLGQSIDSEGVDDFFGHSVSLDSIGNTVAIGAMFNDGNGSNSGHVRIFENIGGSWTQIGQDIDGEASDDQSGNALSISSDGSIVCIGAQNNDGNGTNSGQARIYKNIGGTWTQIGLDIDGENAGDESGYFISTSNNGKIIAIGGQKNDGNGTDAGHVRVYFLCEAAEGTDTRTECNSYTWIDGNTYTSSNNSATHTLTNVNGCDSIVTLDLTINNVSDLTTSVSGIEITATNSNASYQWLDCDDNNSIINGENGQSFTATANGNYAVELTENGCIDTTNCIAITTVGIVENTFENELVVSPNPTHGKFSIDLGQTYGNVQITILDATGWLIESKTVNQSQKFNLSIEREPIGVYIITVQAENKKAVIRLVKE
ncbi:MAG: hypothetical protein ACJA0U_003088 [Salibacteraceae bacterium]|jgi:hypothetical protein